MFSAPTGQRPTSSTEPGSPAPRPTRMIDVVMATLTDGAAAGSAGREALVGRLLGAESGNSSKRLWVPEPCHSF